MTGSAKSDFLQREIDRVKSAPAKRPRRRPKTKGRKVSDVEVDRLLALANESMTPDGEIYGHRD